MLAELKAIGVRFALDDFGTGYSSLGYLQKVAFSRIKIDRSFVQHATVPRGEAVAIIQAIVALATSLGMTTTPRGPRRVRSSRSSAGWGASRSRAICSGGQ